MENTVNLTEPVEEPLNEPRGSETRSDRPTGHVHKRSLSGGGLSKLSILRATAKENQIQADTEGSGPEPEKPPTSPKKASRAMSVAIQQQRTRKRKGSLRKAALLGRGAQRDKKELEVSPLITSAVSSDADGSGLNSPGEARRDQSSSGDSGHDAVPAPVLGYSSKGLATGYPAVPILAPVPIDPTAGNPGAKTNLAMAYASTTDEEDVLTFPKHSPPVPAAISSSAENYFSSVGASALFRRRSKKVSPNSPLALVSSSLPSGEDTWDYSETEWWGWIILIVTWIVFVVGMGSCLGVWSWAWDVGETPYAPPELEDDPTLPIVGYYPALMILTCVMAWVWVVIAWVGMKYFRHAKITGD